MKVLCVCTGNICRSAMLPYLLKQELDKQGITDFTFSGAGTETVDGAPPTPHAVTAMKEIGIDITGHRSRQLTTAIVDDYDVFIAMEPHHGVTLAFIYGADPEKIIIPGNGIPDPFGRDLPVYRRCRDLLCDAVPQIIADLKTFL